MSEFELDNPTNATKKVEPETLADGVALKHELDEFPDLTKKEASTDAQLPPYLREIEASYSSPTVAKAKAITDMVDDAYSEITTKAYNRFWPDFLKEADEIEPAAFNKDSELPPELEQHYNLLKENLSLEFDHEKMQILAQTEKRFNRSIGNILAKNDVYKRLQVAYESSMESERNISPETLYEYQQQNKNIIKDFANAKERFLESVSEQYDKDHLGELTRNLDMNSNALIDDVIQGIENKVAPTKLALGNAIAPEISKSTLPLRSKMMLNFDVLEENNDRATEKAIEDFKRRVRRDARRARSNDIQIHVDELGETSKALHTYVDEPQPSVETEDQYQINVETPAVKTPVEAPIVETPVEAEPVSTLDAELNAVLNGPGIPPVTVVETPAEPEVITPEPKVEEESATEPAPTDTQFDPFGVDNTFGDLFGTTQETPVAETPVEPVVATPEPQVEEEPTPEPAPTADPFSGLGFDNDPFSVDTTPETSANTSAPSTDFDPFADLTGFTADTIEDPIMPEPAANETTPVESAPFNADEIFSDGLGTTEKPAEPEKTDAEKLEESFKGIDIFDHIS